MVKPPNRVLVIAASEDAEAAVRSRRAGRCEAALLVLDGRGDARLRSLRAAAPALPVIVVVPKGREADGVEALRAGAQDFLIEGSFDAKGLRSAVEKALARARALERRLTARAQELMA
jgi:DNA-binding NarL/FixJ family response regulator